MKIFRYERGHEAGKTLTVAELKNELDKYPDNMPVMATWEGVYAYIHPENFNTEYICKGDLQDRELCLVIDVEEY